MSVYLPMNIHRGRGRIGRISSSLNPGSRISCLSRFVFLISPSLLPFSGHRGSSENSRLLFILFLELPLFPCRHRNTQNHLSRFAVISFCTSIEAPLSRFVSRFAVLISLCNSIGIDCRDSHSDSPFDYFLWLNPSVRLGRSLDLRFSFSFTALETQRRASEGSVSS